MVGTVMHTNMLKNCSTVKQNFFNHCFWFLNVTLCDSQVFSDAFGRSFAGCVPIESEKYEALKCLERLLDEVLKLIKSSHIGQNFKCSAEFIFVKSEDGKSAKLRTMCQVRGAKSGETEQMFFLGHSLRLSSSSTYEDEENSV